MSADYDNFNVSKLENGEVYAVGGTWHGEGGATCDFTVATKRNGGKLPDPLAMAREFDKQMQKVTDAMNTSEETVTRWSRLIINMAIDQQVRDIFRRTRVEEGATDHKKMLRKESFPCNICRFARTVRRSGVELGWLFGLDVRWNWKYVRPEGRPFDWEYDCRW